MSSSTTEMIRVRVRFLKPGDRINVSEFDDTIHEHSMNEGHGVYGEDCWDLGIFKLSSADLADSICLRSNLMVSSPNDPVVEIIKATWIMYFDLLELDADWGSKGVMGWTIEEVGLFDTFEKEVPTLLEYARGLKGHEDDGGSKVQFLTLWHYSSWCGYWGEWNSEHSLEGFFTPGGSLQKFPSKKRPQEKSMTETLGEVLSDKDAMARMPMRHRD